MESGTRPHRARGTRVGAASSRDRWRRLVGSAGTVGVISVAALTGAGALPAHAEDVDLIEVDFASSTGAFRGGASGMLYGLGDDGVPTDAIVAGARPLNVTQKAPRGAQHPNGDPLEVEDQFFRNGGEYLMTNIQDYYPDWPYNGGRRPADFETYLDIVRTVVTSVVEDSDHPERYVFTPFNEPDGNWYRDWPVQKDTFLADWKAVYETIKDVYPEARIAGTGDTRWQPGRTRDWLEYAKQHDVMPDMVTWHELGITNLATYRTHHREYRQLERELGIDSLPVNITEYAMRRDMSVPGQLVQWLAMFEDTKVDAQTAYWTFAGNLNDNMAKSNSANGAWWLLKWYGDLTGETVSLTPPALDTVDTVQGIATLDESKPQASVLYGGGSRDVRLDLSGLDPTVFGSTVDVQVREARWSGQEGAAPAPPVVLAERVALTDGALDVTVPGGDRLSAFQVVVTPSLAVPPVVDTTWRAEIEAEDTRLTDVVVYPQSMSDAWTFAASGQRDVGSTNQVGSSLTWTLDVPTTGTYRFGVVAGVNGPAIGPGKHALFVDGERAVTVEYEAGFGWSYRGRAEVLLDLEAGTRELSLRMSADGQTLLPGSDISVDKLDLTRVDGPETDTYPANLARLDGAEIRYVDGREAGSVRLAGDASATFYVAVRETGYYDVQLAYRADDEATVGLSLNGRRVPGLAAGRAGSWSSTARVHLAAGVSQLVVTSPDGVDLSSLTTVRAAGSDALAYRTEAENPDAVTLHGGARLERVSEPTNASGQHLGWLGGGAASFAVLDRPADLGAGPYNLVVRYANAEKNTGHDYNTDVITRFLDVTEAGGGTTRGAFRHNYSWKGFWTHTVPVDLVTDDGDLTLGNGTAWAPNIDWLALAPLVADVTNDRLAGAVRLAVSAESRCIARTGSIEVQVLNEETQPVRVTFGSDRAARTVTLGAGQDTVQPFPVPSGATPAGTVTVTGSVGERSSSYEASYGPLACR